MHWYFDVLKKYAVFSGRARRTEFWMFFLFNCIIAFVLGAIDGYLRTQLQTIQVGTVLVKVQLGVIGGLYSLAVLIPIIAVSVRRLHDTGRSGWWNLIWLVPCIGLILIVWFAGDSQPGRNEYGPNPKAAAA